MSTLSLCDQMSENGHETNGEMAERNLSITVESLNEMRWMIVNAVGINSEILSSFDDGVSKLSTALATLQAETQKS